jgi:hypothetical protein
MINKKTVYVSGPYTQGSQDLNVAKAIETGEMLWGLGYVPIIPHLSILWQIKYAHTWEEWIDMDLTILQQCDYIYRIPGKSPGADMEMAHAKANGVEELRLSYKLVVREEENE